MFRFSFPFFASRGGKQKLSISPPLSSLSHPFPRSKTHTRTHTHTHTHTKKKKNNTVDWSTGDVDAPLLSWYLPIAGIWPYSKEKEAAAQAAVKKALAALDAVLATRTFLVGDAVTLADVVGACNLWLGFTKLFDAGYRAGIPNVTRWFDTLVHQPAFAKVLGDVPLADKAAVYDAAAAKNAVAAEAVIRRLDVAAGRGLLLLIRPHIRRQTVCQARKGSCKKLTAVRVSGMMMKA